MIADEQSTEAQLRRYVSIFRRRRGVVALMTLVVVGTALLASLLQTPVYEGKARVLIRQDPNDSLFADRGGSQTRSQQAIQTEIELLTSEPVREAVRQRLGTAPRFSAAQVGQTEVIEIKAQSTDPRQAAEVANAYANAYTDLRRKQTVEELLSAGREIQAKVTDLQRQIDALPPPPGPGQPANAGTQRRDTLVQQQALFRQKIDELQVDAAVRSGGAQVVTPASVPATPIKPTKRKNVLIALAVGLTFGVAMAFLFEYLDDSIRGKEDLERAAPGLPTLALIPSVTTWKDQKRTFVASLGDSKSPAAEAYRSLRTSLQFIGLDRPLRTILITSPSAGEGKTTTIANLGVALAQSEQRVVIVSCDLRRPRVHQFFGFPNTVGFTSLLLGDAPLSAALHRVEGTEGRLSVITSGPVPPNPSELLAGHRAVEVFTALQAVADVVLVDSPPILPVTDAAVLATRVDGTLLLATAGETTRRELQRAHEILRQVDAPLLGTVLNGVTGDAGYGYSYGYKYAYAYAEPESNGRRGRQRAAQTS